MADDTHDAPAEARAAWQDAWSSDADVAADRLPRPAPAPDLPETPTDGGTNPLEAFPSEQPAHSESLLVRSAVAPDVAPTGGPPRAPAPRESRRRTDRAVYHTPRGAVATASVAAVALAGLIAVAGWLFRDTGDGHASQSPEVSAAATSMEAVPAGRVAPRAREVDSGGQLQMAPPLADTEPLPRLQTGAAAPEPSEPLPRTPAEASPPAADDPESTPVISQLSDSRPSELAARTTAGPAEAPESPGRPASEVPAADVGAAPTPALAVSTASPAPSRGPFDTWALARPAPSTLATADSAVPAVAPPAVATLDDRQLIGTALERYRAAFNALDANAARSVWPSVDATALDRAFGQLASQDMAFSSCSVSVNGSQATASCSGSTTYVTSIGNRGTRTDYRLWDFALRKTGQRWLITAVDSR